MDEKHNLKMVSQTPGSSPILASAHLRDGGDKIMPLNDLNVDMDEKFMASGSRGLDVPSSPTSRSEVSDEQENAPLLEDEVLEKQQPDTEVRVQTSTKTSFIKPEHRIALTHFLVSGILHFSDHY